MGRGTRILSIVGNVHNAIGLVRLVLPGLIRLVDWPLSRRSRKRDPPQETSFQPCCQSPQPLQHPTLLPALKSPTQNAALSPLWSHAQHAHSPTMGQTDLRPELRLCLCAFSSSSRTAATLPPLPLTAAARAAPKSPRPPLGVTWPSSAHANYFALTILA